MLNEKYKTITNQEQRNLNGVIEDYIGRYCDDHKLDEKEKKEVLRICNDIICPQIKENVPATAYTDLYAINLRNLFRRIQGDSGITNADFRANIRPLITEPLEHYLEEQYHEEEPLWGIWYKAEDYPGGVSECELDLYVKYDDVYTLGRKEKSALAENLIREDAPGELIGYALMLYTGASAEDLGKVKYSDIYRLLGEYNDRSVHYMGSFPKFTNVTDDDVRPRFVPLPDKIDTLLRRRLNVIDAKMRAPLKDTSDYKGADDFPIVCHGKSYKEHSSAHQVSMAACRLLREIGFDELRIAMINSFLLERPTLLKTEGSGALYLARRSYTFDLFKGGVDEKMMQYLLGMDHEDGDAMSDPEKQHEAKEQIERELQL